MGFLRDSNKAGKANLGGGGVKPTYEELLTQVAELEKLELASSSISELDPNPVMEVGLDGRERYANQVARRLFPDVQSTGLAHPWLAGWEEVVRTVEGATTPTLVRVVEVGDRHYQQTFRYVADVDAIRIYGVDISDLQRTERALSEAEKRFRDWYDDAPSAFFSVGLEGTILGCNRRAVELLGYREEELRNPLTPIRNCLYILNRAPPGGEQARRAQVIMDRQVSHLVHLVDDLLDVTRISRGKIRIQRSRLDLVDVVRRTVDDYGSLLEGYDLRVDLPNEPIWADGDATRLSQVVGNLLSNAVKFTPKGGAIALSLRSAAQRAVLEVADTGMGIDPETRARLFEPFEQADRSLDRSRGGLGLGLALVKGIVALHEGDVRAESDGPGRGARFTVTLPLASHVPASPGAPPSQEPAGGGRFLLIIEDNMDAAETLSDVLTGAGYRVAVAYDGEAGVKKARELKPDFVLCDIGLPGAMDGYAVARTLRKEAGLASARLVALSGYAQPEDRRRAAEAGFDAHLAKPPELSALQRVLGPTPSAVAEA